MHKCGAVILLIGILWVTPTLSKQLTKFDELVAEGHTMIFKDLNSALTYADSLLAIAKQSEDQRNLGLTYDLLGRAQVFAGQLEKARPNFDRALKYFDGYPDSLAIKTNRNLGLLHYFNDELDSAILLSQKAATYYEEKSNHLEAAKSYANIGSFYTSQERPMMSIKATYKAIDYFKKGADADYHIGRMYVNLGAQYSSLDRFEQSKEYYVNAMLTGFDSTDLVSSALLYNNIGSVYWRLGEIDSAQIFFQKALTQAMQSGDLRRKCSVYRSIGRMYLGLGQYEQAVSYIEKSIEEAHKGPFPDMLYSGQVELAECKVGLGLLKEAEDLLNSSEDEGYAYQLLLREARHGILADLYQKKGGLRDAYLHLNDRLSVTDSIKSEKLQRQFDELRIQYEVQEKENLIYDQRMSLAEAERRYQSRLNMILIISLIMILTLLGLVTYLKYQSHRKSKLLLSSQIELIQNQLSPHFLYNSLNIVSSLIKQDKEKARTAIAQLKELYQRMLDSFGHDLISVADELSILQAYFSLMVHRFGNSVNLNVNVTKEDDHIVVPFTFQMLAENAIKHNSISNRLTINLLETEQHYIVENEISHMRNGDNVSTKKGLKLLIQKYSLLGKNIPSIEQRQDKFIVKIPKIRA